MATEIARGSSMALSKSNNSNAEAPMRIAFSVRELATSIGLSQRKIRQDMHSGRLGFIRFGRKILIAKDQIEEYVRNHSVACFDAADVAEQIIRRKR